MGNEHKDVLSTDLYLSKIFKNPEQRAATSVLATTAAALKGKGCKYLENCQVIGPWDPSSGM